MLSTQKDPGPKLLHNVHVPGGSIVQLFPIHGESHLEQLTKGMNIKSGWKWTRNSVVFGTLSDTGVILIWDLLTRRPIMRLEVEGAVSCLWTTFVVSPTGNLFVFLKDKFRLSFKELTEPVSSVSHMTSVVGIEHMTGFCTPQMHENHLIYPNGTQGIAAIGFSRHDYPLDSKDNGDGLVISKLLPSPDTNRGMIVILFLIADWLVIAYEDGYVTIYNVANGQVMYNCELKEYYKDEDDESVTPMPMACTGSAKFGRIIISVAGVRPRLFILNITDQLVSCLVPATLVPSIVYVDGCSDLAAYDKDNMDIIAISGLSGSVDVHRISDCSHLVNIPHGEKIIKKLMFIPKSNRRDSNSVSSSSVMDEVMLLCASDSTLSLWNFGLGSRSALVR